VSQPLCRTREGRLPLLASLGQDQLNGNFESSGAQAEFDLPSSRRPLRSHLTPFLLYFILLAAVLGISWRDNAFQGEFGNYPDESAHYVTGLMFHDYFVSLHYLSPIKFAENFYMHYPKVALGHWPPAFYVIQGIWGLLFSTSHTSLMFLMAALTALLGLVVYKMLTNQLGSLLAFAVALGLIALPLVQNHTTLVMADIPLTLFSLVAAIFFGRYLDTEKLKDSLWFGAFASLAIMTKGSAVAIALLPPIAILVSGKWSLLRKSSLWSSAAIVVAACGPWYWMTRHMQKGTWVQSSPTLWYTLSTAKFFSFHFFKILGWPLASLALLGFIVTLVGLSQFVEQKTFWAAMIGLLFGFFIVPCVIPVGREERYFLPAVPAAMAFSAAGINFLGSRLPKRLKPAILSSTFLFIFLLTPFRFQRERNYGFAPIAQTLTSSPQFYNAVILIASDADGEGMIISEIAMREKRPGHLVLRASKILTTGNWTGTQVTPIFQTPEQVQNYLDSIPVSVVVLDNSVSPTEYQVYEGLLEQAIVSHPNSWKLLGSYSIWRKGIEHGQAALVYIRSAPAENARGIIRIDMTSMLGKALTLELGSAQNGGTR
jgi:Dolichyl-phosphate-mannose-protein mannosyltransferase